MASLTPLSKGLIGLAVVGAMASAVWHLGLKDRLSGQASPSAPSSSTAPAPGPAVAATTAPQPPVNAGTSTTQPAATTGAAAPQATPQSNRLSPAENSEAGRKLLESGNDAQARVHLEQAVKDGDGSAACHLGDMTLKGRGGIAASPEKATALFQLAQSRNIICFAPGR